MTRQSLAIVAALFALGATQLRAQEINSPYRFVEQNQSGEVYIGHMATDPGSEKLGPQSANMFGVRYSIRFNGPLAFEAQLGYMPSKRTVFDTVTVNSVPRSVGTTDLTLASAMGVLRFVITGQRTWHNLSPMLLFGGGVLVDVGGESALNDQVPPTAKYKFGTSFAGLLGAGVEWFATPRIGVRADARANLWQVKTPEAFLSRTGFVADEWTQNVLFSGGLAYHF